MPVTADYCINEEDLVDMKMIIGADVVPTESNRALFESGDIISLVGEGLTELLHAADYRIFNLEVPLCDQEKPIIKLGPHLIAPTKTVEGYKKLGANLLTLANNHILDQGLYGLQSTIEALDNAGIAYVGVGMNSEEASKAYTFAFAGKKIGIYACAEHEFSIADETRAGANPFDPLESPDHVSQIKAACDYVIVLYHGGKEHYRYPSPKLQKVCRKLIQKGADLVICQHSHCIGCEEKYGNGTIVYGQGNFLFDASSSEFWQTSLLISINELFELEYIPIVRRENKVRLASENEANKIMCSLMERSAQIKQPGFVEQKYKEFAKSMLSVYLKALSGKESILFRALNKITGNSLRTRRLKRIYGKRQYLYIRNYVECEAHRELLLAGVASMLVANEDKDCPCKVTEEEEC